MNTLEEDDVRAAILEIRDLLRLLASEPIAVREVRRREALLQIVGQSKPRAAAVLRMDGTRSQANIHKQTGIHKGQLSDLVKALSNAELLAGDIKQPKLVTTLATYFFSHAKR